VEKRPAALIDRQVDQVAQPEAEQDAPLHPGVDAPASRARRVRLRGADGARRQRVAQPRERGASGLAIGPDARRHEAVNLLLQRHAKAGLFNRFNSQRTLRIFSLDSGRGATSGSRYTSSSSPIAAIAVLSGPGLDSMKFTCINGKMRSCSARAAAR